MKHAMRDLVCLLLLLGVMAICSRSWAQAPASLVVTSDMDCNWKLDGVEQARLSVDNANVIKTIVGEHLIQATSLDGQAKWQRTVTADSWAQKLVKISLSDMLPFWADPATGLTWAKKDNGSDATWSQANEYCRNLRLGGRSGWRVPTVDELWGIFDQTMAGQQGLHPKGGIRLSWPGVWSSTQGNNSEEKWAFSFYNGIRGSSKLGPSNINRALCVRGSDFRPSQHNGQVGSCIISFEACSAFTHGRKSRLRYWIAGYGIEKFHPITERSEFSDHLAGAVLP